MTKRPDQAIAAVAAPRDPHQVERPLGANSPLTARECQCLSLLAGGSTNRDIGQQLNISLPTVALHLLNARRKLHARTREQAIAIAVSSGLIKMDRLSPAIR